VRALTLALSRKRERESLVSSMSSSLDAEHLTANNKYTDFEWPTLGAEPGT